jgi:hypothetical protein
MADFAVVTLLFVRCDRHSHWTEPVATLLHPAAFACASSLPGCSAGDSVGPVLGAIIYDRSGLQAVFVLLTAINALPLLLVLPVWT